MKSKRNIIIAAVIIIILAAGTLIISRIDTDKGKPQTEAGSTYTVYSEEASDLAEVLVEAGDTEIKAVNTGKSEWTVNDLPPDEIDGAKAYSLAGTVSTIISKSKFEAPSDLTQYGLDNPSITVTITKKDGASDKLYVGDMSPTLGDYFIKLDGDDDVYTMYAYKVDTLLKPLEYYKEFDRFNVNPDDITDIKIERGDGTIELRLKDKDRQTMANVWEMAEPYESAANDDYIDNKILAPIENISLSTPVNQKKAASTVLTLTIKPFDNETGKYSEEYTETLLIGDAEGGSTYVEYKDEAYEVPSSTVEFVNDSAFNIVSKLQALVDISLVKDVTVEYGGKSHTIGIAKGNGNKYSFTLDGKETDANISQEVYRNIIGIAVDGLYNGGAVSDTLLKLTFNGIKDSDDAVIEFKKLDDLNCAAERNGEALFTVKTSKIDEFISLFEQYVEKYE